MFKKKKETRPHIDKEKLSDIVLQFSDALYEEIVEGRELTEDNRLRIFIATHVYFYILLDRSLYSVVTGYERDEVSKNVYVMCLANIQLSLQEGADDFQDTFNSYINFLGKYSQLMYPEHKGDGLKGTYFWEFAKLIGVFAESSEIGIAGSARFMEYSLEFAKATLPLYKNENKL